MYLDDIIRLQESINNLSDDNREDELHKSQTEHSYRTRKQIIGYSGLHGGTQSPSTSIWGLCIRKFLEVVAHAVVLQQQCLNWSLSVSFSSR